jgi:hypothetical protein
VAITLTNEPDSSLREKRMAKADERDRKQAETEDGLPFARRAMINWVGKSTAKYARHWTIT